eukprot:SAG11_NODE_2166_length_3726_cov_6.269369_3_plen_73_part_00
MYQSIAVASAKHSLTSNLWLYILQRLDALDVYEQGSEVAVNFLAGYLIEKSLSLDNLFVILLTFESFRIQPA